LLCSPALEARVSETEPGPQPAAPDERISAVDVLRGVAVLGILLVNIEDFGLPHADKSAPGTEWVGAYFPAALGPRALAAWTIFRALFEGRMRAIFSMLFGAGVVLLTSRLERRGEGARAADVYTRRTLWLLLFGVLHAYLLWEGDILYGYALCGLFLYPFRRLSGRAAVVVGALVLSLSLPRAALVAHHREELRRQAAAARADEEAGRPLAPSAEDARDDWDEIMESFRPDPRRLEESSDDYRGGYARLFARRAPLVAIVESSDFYGWAFFDAAGMMLLGMGLLKLGVLGAERSRRFYLAMVGAGWGVGLPLGALAAYRLGVERFDPVAVAWLTAAYDPARLAVALGHVGVVMLVVKSGRARWLTRSLADVGRVALSCYLGATIACTTLFNGYGLGLYGALGRTQLYAVVLVVWAAQVAFARLWLRAYRFGPAEWAWRSLTYWRAQPLRRRRPAAAVEKIAAGVSR
jgi:uncharacterized protein